MSTIAPPPGAENYVTIRRFNGAADVNGGGPPDDRFGPPEAPLPDADDRSAVERFPLVRFDDIKMSTDPAYLIKGLIPRTGLVVIWGPPKCGKSFWTLDLAMHIACGWSYRGMRVREGSVVYLALEGAEGFKRRIEAFRRKYPRAKGAPFHLMSSSLDLIRDRGALIEAVRAQLGDVWPAVIVIDTLNRSLVGSESSDEDMGAYVRAANALERAFGCVVPIVHHCGHNGDRPRGHSSLLGGLDVQIAVKKDEAGGITAIVEAAKDAPSGLVIVSRLETVDLGADKDGDPITSCVIEAVGEIGDTKPAKRKEARLAAGPQNALAALHEAIAERGVVPPASNHVPVGVRTVTIEQWRGYAFRMGVSQSDKDHAKGAAFKRAANKLHAAKKIGIWAPHVWVA